MNRMKWVLAAVVCAGIVLVSCDDGDDPPGDTNAAGQTGGTSDGAAPSPANGSYLFYEDFENGLGAWHDHEHPDRMRTSTGVSYRGTAGLVMDFNATDGEVGPGWMYRRFFPQRAGTDQETEGVEEVFVRWYQRWSANWQWPGEGYGPHNLYILAGDVDGLATTELTIYVEMRNGRPLAMIVGSHQDIDYQDWEATSADPIQFDRWYCVEVRAKMNDPGQANGIIQVWLDGHLVIDRRDLTLRHNRIGLDGTTLSFHELAIGPWYHGGIQSSETMHIWIDELAAAAQRIGCEAGR